MNRRRTTLTRMTKRTTRTRWVWHHLCAEQQNGVSHALDALTQGLSAAALEMAPRDWGMIDAPFKMVLCVNQVVWAMFRNVTSLTLSSSFVSQLGAIRRRRESYENETGENSCTVLPCHARYGQTQLRVDWRRQRCPLLRSHISQVLINGQCVAALKRSVPGNSRARKRSADRSEGGMG